MGTGGRVHINGQVRRRLTVSGLRGRNEELRPFVGDVNGCGVALCYAILFRSRRYSRTRNSDLKRQLFRVTG